MRGDWMYLPDRGEWCLFDLGRPAIHMSFEALESLCFRTGWSRRDALAWVATRPSEPAPMLLQPASLAA